MTSCWRFRIHKQGVVYVSNFANVGVGSSSRCIAGDGGIESCTESIVRGR